MSTTQPTETETYVAPNAVPMRRAEFAGVVVTLIAIMRGTTIDSFEIGTRELGATFEIAGLFLEEQLEAACAGHEALCAFLTALDAW
jgi:hypothetical protein